MGPFFFFRNSIWLQIMSRETPLLLQLVYAVGYASLANTFSEPTLPLSCGPGNEDLWDFSGKCLFVF